MLRIGIDTGGTFTDFVVHDQEGVQVFKLPSTPEHPEKSVLEGLSRIVGERNGFLVQHGSTVATNTLLERKGARTLLVTNQGLEDVIEIGRQNRPELYSLKASRPETLIPRRLRVGIRERRLWDGTSLIHLEKKSLDWLRGKVEQLKPEAVAVVLLYSYVNGENELKIAESLQEFGIPVSLSHQVLPEFREFERTSATVLNAYLTPRMGSYLAALSRDEKVQRGRLTIMQSNGGSISAEVAQREPVHTLFSGPAGGVVGAFEAARKAGFEKIITFDMGGTSTDVSLCDGRLQTTTETVIDHFPVAVPMLAIHSVGAGGGSIAWLDSGGLLRVGPASAGAEPGPVCYGKGEAPTVTDAHVYLGHMDPDYLLSGQMRIYPERVAPALDNLAGRLSSVSGKEWKRREIAEGILRITNTQLEGAIRLISLQKGFDPRDFTLVCFGGAGGLHACELARTLRIPRVLIPPDPGTLSAAGVLQADVVKDASQTIHLESSMSDLAVRFEEAFVPLQRKVSERMGEEGFSSDQVTLSRSVDARYAGQSFEINTPWSERVIETFHELHQQQYGYCNPSLPVEIVNIRVQGRARYPQVEVPSTPLGSEQPPLEAVVQEKKVWIEGEERPTAFYLRHNLKPGNRIAGPAILLEYSSTTLVSHDFQACIDGRMNLIIEPLKSG